MHDYLLMILGGCIGVVIRDFATGLAKPSETGLSVIVAIVAGIGLKFV